MVYYERTPPEEERPPGCLDAVGITRAVFGILLWPVIAIFAVLADMALIFWLFVSVSPVAGVLAVVATAGAVALYARWEQRHFRPPGG